jgi:tripeptide aminopeptidase
MVRFQVKKINTRQAVELVTRLMAIPGQSCEEGLVAGEVEQVLAEAGVAASAISYDTAHRRSFRSGEIGNLIVRLPGARGLPRLLLSAHLDTVPVCVGSKPKRRGDRISSADPHTGLGADNRAGVAAVLTAAIEASRELGTAIPPLTLCFFVQEEIGLQGSRHVSVSKFGKPTMALNFDGSHPHKMTIGATGGERIKIRLHGLAAHAGLAPDEGASSITCAGLAIASLHKQGWLGAVRRRGKSGTSNIGVVRGGVATNVVAEYTELDAEARSHDSAFRQAIGDALEAAFMEAAAQTRSRGGVAVRAEVERRVDYEPFRLDEDAAVISSVASAIEAAGATPQSVVSNGGLDANWMVRHGLPTVTVGCGQRDVHTTQETLDIPDFLAACQIGKNVIYQVAAQH